jgi:hypothetical protein
LGGDAGGEGLKNAVSQFEGSWYVAAALAMTIGFALITVKPVGTRPGSLGDELATYVYVTLVLLATINSVLGVWWAGHMVPQVHWHPAANFSKFWFAAMNTSMGHAQQFAKISIEQLLLALVPLCYLNYGIAGLIISTVSLGYFHLQRKTYDYLMQRMRSAYQEGLDSGSPVMDDVSTLPRYFKKPHTEGLFGLLTGQLVSTTCFSLRWLRAPNKTWVQVPVAQVQMPEQPGRNPQKSTL